MFSVNLRILDAVPSGATYIVMSLLVRSTMALGFAGFWTANLSILAKEFPNKIATVDVRNYIFLHVNSCKLMFIRNGVNDVLKPE